MKCTEHTLVCEYMECAGDAVIRRNNDTKIGQATKGAW